MKRSYWILGLVLLAAVGVAIVVALPREPVYPTPPVEQWDVAIATLMPHPALDQVEQGVKERMRELGYVEGKNLRWVERNANGEVQLAASIANDLASQELDAVVAITTPMAQAAAKVVRSPLIFSAVTDPVGAGLVSSLDSPRPLITGTCDAWPYQAQLELIRRILPQAKRLGVLYNPGEAASQYGIQKIREHAPKLGFEIRERAVSTTTEVFPAAAGLATEVDALFLSSDNTVIGGVAGAVKVAIQKKKPLFVGDSGTVAKGGLAAVSVGYHQLGRQTGELVDRMLRGERNLPVVVATGADIYLNREAARQMGVTLSPELEAQATQVYNSIEG